MFSFSLLQSAIDDRFVWGVASNPLEFGHFSMTAERSNRIAQAAVAEAMAPLMLW
jgi:hypothetical protein